jgi:hypothetical protein
MNPGTHRNILYSSRSTVDMQIEGCKKDNQRARFPSMHCPTVEHYSAQKEIFTFCKLDAVEVIA